MGRTFFYSQDSYDKIRLSRLDNKVHAIKAIQKPKGVFASFNRPLHRVQNETRRKTRSIKLLKTRVAIA